MRADKSETGVAFPDTVSHPHRFAIVIHLFYEDQWPEFERRLQAIGHDFTLFVSLTPESTFEEDITRAFPDAIVRRFANLGRDVAPFLAFLPELQAYDVVCKLHSKRSEDGHTGWRQRAAEEMIGGAGTVAAYLDAFARDPDLVLAGPREFYLDGRQHIFQSRRALELQHSDIPAIWGFFAGTMFWCRPQFYRGLEEIFPQDVFAAHGDADGHPEHVIERSFGLMAAQEGKTIMLWDGTALIAPASTLRGNPDWSETYERLEEIEDAEIAEQARVDRRDPSSLMTLHRAHRGFVSDKWSGNLTHYDRLLRDFRDRDVRLLEIGVQNGGSLQVWSSYFPNGRVFVGCDINEACADLTYDDPRIHVVVCDAGSPLAKTRIMELSGRFDIVIDDGSHKSSDIIRAFLQYFSSLIEGGVYIVEDLHCSYWTEFEGGLDYASSSLAFFRAVTDVINLEHWQEHQDVASRFREFSDAYDLEIDVRIFNAISSIEFVNSMVILRKGGPRETELGTRSVSGQIARVHKGVVDVDGTQSRVPGREDREGASGSLSLTQARRQTLSISVVIPFYNGSAFLPDAVASIEAQSVRPRETIVVDDGSSPTEAAWLAQFAKDADIRVLTQPNAGQGGARNTGVSAASGSHICLLDQDDVFCPDHNAVLVHHWRSVSSPPRKIGWVFASLSEANDALGVMRRGVFPYPHEPIPSRMEDCLARDLTIFPSTTMISRDAFLEVGGFDARLRGYEDDDLFLRLLLAGYEGSFCQADVALWRRHAGQTSQSMVFIESARIFFEKWMSHPWTRERDGAFARSNLRARMLKNLQYHLRQDEVYDAAALWDLYHMIEGWR